MSLTRSQLLAGDSSQGSVLEGQVQGVKKGAGVVIALDGTISFEASSAEGVVKTNNQFAFNNYVWPSVGATPGTYLTLGANNSLSWTPVIQPGFGLTLDGSAFKISVPFSDGTPEPLAGTEPDEATLGSLYWNTDSKQLFIYNGTSWEDASYGPPDLTVDLLTGKYTLYVDYERGSDIYVTGLYEGLPKQMATSGYTPQRPFKTIQRAALEVARIQIALGNDAELYDRFIIQCQSGTHLVDNGLGSNSVIAWTPDTTPTDAQLRAMNSSSYGGVILPRGVSVVGQDLRKTVIRPLFVPAKTGDMETDRASIFRVTGGGFFFNFTFKDKVGLNESHHLLDCFSFVSDSDLTSYYNKVRDIFAQSAPNNIVNPGETEIVAPVYPGTALEDTDDVFGSSPYIFNCSVRSKYGLCGINADGNDVSGFKSMVTAQFTGVSLQKDLSCWQRYNPGPKNWTNTITNYNLYISLDPNNLRMDPKRRSFHIRAVNGAFLQEVSVFAIGQGIHHWAKNGGELSITNSNSSFGGCAALAEGYKNESFPQDTNWNVATINVATNLTDQTRIVNSLNLGVVDSSVGDSDLTIKMTLPLADSAIYPGIPEILATKNYTLRSGSYLWIENPNGPDWRAPLAAIAWNPSLPDEIKITVPMQNQAGQFPGVGINPNLAGSKVYIRRLADTRTESQRRYSLNITNTDNNVRTPPRDYVVQTTVTFNVDPLPDDDMVLVNKSGSLPVGVDPVSKKAQIVLQRSNPDNPWISGNLYRPGDTVKKDKKHFTCVIRNSDLVFDQEKWSESYVHTAIDISGMPDYNAYDYFNTISPAIFFDNDTDGNTSTTTCGYNLSTCWASDDLIKKQYTTSTDYRGVYQFLRGIGFSPAQTEDILLPTTSTNRELNPASSSDMKFYEPDGAVDFLANWPIEFRRPTTVRIFGHAWEWAGFLNYSKALPAYQGDLSPQNQFTYYFTNQMGGRVYATGFNQEGYFVTAAGLTDLATGSTITISDIGNPFGGIDIPTYFPNLTVGNLVVENSAIFNGTEFTVNGPITADNVYTPGLGLAVENKNLKVSIPEDDSPPTSGTGTLESTTGSLYWDNELSQLFIRYDNGGNPVWVSAAPSSTQPSPFNIVEGTGIRLIGPEINKSFAFPSGFLPDLTYTTNTTLTEPIYYCENLVINSGVTVSVSHQTTVIFCLGNVVINGTLNGNGRGALGGTSVSSYSQINTSLLNTTYGNSGSGFGGGYGNINRVGSPPTANYNFTSSGLISPFQSLAGSGGGSASTAAYGWATSDSNVFGLPGGAGGAGIIIRSRGSIQIGATGSITADGNPGWTSAAVIDSWISSPYIGSYMSTGAGGGSGGTIILHSDSSISNLGTLSVRGGNGSAPTVTDTAYWLSGPRSISGGSGGGGGFVVLQAKGVVTPGTSILTGGSFGASTGSGALSFGGSTGGSNAGAAGYLQRNLSSPSGWDQIPSQSGKLLTFGSPFD